MRTKKFLIVFVIIALGVSISFLFYTVNSNSTYNYCSNTEIRNTELLNKSPYSMFGDSSIMLMTEHERKNYHTLEILNNNPTNSISKLLLDSKTGVIKLIDKNNVIVSELQLKVSQFARFMTTDRFAEKYYDFSPYQYAANNPICNIDVNGDSIWFSYQYNKNNELTGVTMNVSGKVINTSSNNINMDKALASISSQIESSFQGTLEGVSFTTVTHLSVANSMDEVSKSDHVFAIADINNDNVTGAANQFGGKVAFVNADYFSGPWDANIGNTGQRTAAHEFGHLANLVHPSSGQYFNLMKQGAGNSWFSMSTNINESQLGKIHSSYKSGSLNQGSNVEYVPVYTQNGIVYKAMPNRGIVRSIVNY